MSIFLFFVTVCKWQVFLQREETTSHIAASTPRVTTAEYLSCDEAR